MTMLQAVILALVQGATEFLPVSSSGHLVLAQSFLGVGQEHKLFWDVALHVGTLGAIVALFWRDIMEIAREWLMGMAALRGEGFRAVWRERELFRWGWYIILGTIPAAVVGLSAGDAIGKMFSNPLATAALLFATGEILWLTRPHNLMHASGALRLGDSLIVGLAQATALLPGISRSGITISAGLMRGVGRAQAARFSFLLSVPVILGAAILHARQMQEALPHDQIVPLLAGIGTAMVSGYIALRLLLRIVRAGRLHWFSYYCWGLSIVTVAWFWMQSEKAF